jgi:polysaccharide biosynthesis protein PslA
LTRYSTERFIQVNRRLTASFPLLSTDGQSRPSAFRKKRLRSLLYVGLTLCDGAAIRSGVSIGSFIRGWRWLELYGIDIGWLVLPLYLMLALRNRAISIDALRRRSESLRRGTSALIVGFAIFTLMMFLRFADVQVSRLAFGVSLVSALVFLCLFRLIFYSCFVAPVKGGLTAELLIVDGVPPREGAYHVFDAAAEGFEPNLADPAKLGWLTTLLEPYDRVVVRCREVRRHAWAQMLKTSNIIGEIQLDDRHSHSLGAIGIGRYHGADTVVVARGPMSLQDRFNKRVMDLVLASCAVAFTAPLMIVIILAIKLDSPGPVFFAQTRLGRSNKPFKILKFRSMYVERSDHDGHRSATRDDDRITRVGRILRKTSLDELPQLFNVLLGSMSLVGPRPHALGSLAGDKLFWEISERYWLRHALKPGITGLAQVRGFRGATHHQSDLEDRLQSDLEYIAGWRLWRDITIIANTIRVVVHPQAF